MNGAGYLWQGVRRPASAMASRDSWRSRLAGQRAGTTSEDAEESERLKREVAELRRANEILESASVFFAKELDRPTTR